MKKRIIFCLLTIICSDCFAQRYLVKLNLDNISDSRIVLSYEDKGQMITDTIDAKSGNQLDFKGKVSETTLAYLTNINPRLGLQIGSKRYVNSPDLMFFLTNEVITIKGNADRIYMSEVHGGEYNKQWNQLNLQLAKLEDSKWKGFKNSYAILSKGDSAGLIKYHIDVQEIAKREDSIEMNFIATHPESIVSMMLLSTMRNFMPVEKLQSEYANLDARYKTTVFGKSISETIAEKLRVSKTISVGKMAENFTKKDINGTNINLTSLRGNVVLIDFWGSWCAPCRADNPHLKKLYDKYKNKGFKIIGIAYEEGHTIEDCIKSWHKAVEQDKLDWIQVLNNGEGGKNDIVTLYGIESFPTKILISKTGKIIGIYKENDSDKLDEKLTGIFK